MDSIKSQPTRGRSVILRATADYEDWAEIIQSRLEAAKVWDEVDSIQESDRTKREDTPGPTSPARSASAPAALVAAAAPQAAPP